MNHSKKVIFCWIPSHIGIQVNDKVGSWAKAALNMVSDKKSKIPYTDFKPKIRQIMTNKWQQLWKENTHNKLFQVQPILKKGGWILIIPEEKKPLLPGYALDILDFILKDEPSPKCPRGNQYTIKHILIECTKLTNIWRRFYNVDNMNKLFRIIDPKQILNFLKSTYLLSKM